MTRGKRKTSAEIGRLHEGILEDQRERHKGRKLLMGRSREKERNSGSPILYPTFPRHKEGKHHDNTDSNDTITRFIQNKIIKILRVKKYKKYTKSTR